MISKSSVIYINTGHEHVGQKNQSDILIQIEAARELSKPFFVIIDRRLSQDELDEIRKYFSKDNVIKRISSRYGKRELYQNCGFRNKTSDVYVDIITQDSIEKD